MRESALQRKMHSMREVLDAALAQLRAEPELAALFERVQLRIGSLPELAIDAALAQQLWINLLSDALRFAAAGEAQPAWVWIGCEARQRGRWTFSVADSGPGFAAQRAGELFEPFKRLHDDGLSQNGVGLSIVGRVTRCHGGRAWAELPATGGAVFRIPLDTD